MAISEEIRKQLFDFLTAEQSCELLPAYLFYLQKKLKLQPVVFSKEKMIYKNAQDVVAYLEKEGKLWRETEIKIGYGPPSVNSETKKIYICPFTGKVFGDNTHPNPQDAIYDWVSNCPQNTERVGGLRVKRFYISEDPEVIANYIKPAKEPITKTVYSSAFTGKLFNSKEAIIVDFTQNFLKPMTLVEVQTQSRYQLEESLVKLISEELQEDKIAAFVESLAEYEPFLPFVKTWVQADE